MSKQKSKTACPPNQCTFELSKDDPRYTDDGRCSVCIYVSGIVAFANECGGNGSSYGQGWV
jgi:hypothetical protein